ncbi:double-strand break repair protein MRE11 isoform X1 [Nematostella vectensis]|uniref:double-strand break repair protein MRE11 isoform X1 n=2 Tax=Nematostella vectensis TaxID=45351 RepID=UPI0020773CC6|nr:double-strand break repair protein MRE11 isoform X1 [Nematostella vectensis]
MADGDGEVSGNTLSILIATDVHLGYAEKDQVRGNDSFVTFEETLQIAKKRNVDFILLGGDLYHENKPSRRTLHASMALFRKFCMGDRVCEVEFLSDQSINFANNRFPWVNYEDPNLNVSIPVFSIHGNHDDPAGEGNLCALDLLSVCGLVNYFGRPASVDDITVSPLLLQKGATKLALYGLGSVRDERLHRTFVNNKVKMLRPKEDPDSWFNAFVLHQNRAKHGHTNYIPEKFLDTFLDLVVWGHEHECLIDPRQSDDTSLPFWITQPGSTVATSLSPGESKQKHVGILEIRPDKAFKMTKVPLQTVRPFYMEDIILSDTDLDPAEEERIYAFLTDKVEQLISRAEDEHAGNIHPRKPSKPLIRLRVDYSGGFQSFSTLRFGQQFVDRVANPKDILLFHRKKVQQAKCIRPDIDEKLLHLRPEALDNTRMEDLVKDYLRSKDNALDLQILSENRMAQALREFVDKDEKDAIQTLVSWQLEVTQKHLKQRNNVTAENIEEAAQKYTELRRQKEGDEEEEEQIKKVLAESRSQVHDDDEMSDESMDSMDVDARPQGKGRGRGSRGGGRGSRGGTHASRGTGEGRGRGRGSRGGRGRGAASAARKGSLITDSFSSASKSSDVTLISSSEDEEFNAPLSSAKTSTQGKRAPSGRSVSKKAIQYQDDSDESDNPFSHAPSSKRQRR